MQPVEDPDEGTLLTVTRKGLGKRTPYSSYRPKNRGAWGIYMHAVDEEETGEVVAAVETHEGDEIVFTSQEGVVIRSYADETSEITSGQAQGVIVQRLEDGDETVAISRLTEHELGAIDDGDGDDPEE